MLNRIFVFSVFSFFSSSLVLAQANESSITSQLKNLRSVPEAQRPEATRKLALDIRILPAGISKVKLADALSHLSTEGDPGKEILQAVAQTLSQALAESPQPTGKDGRPAMPYMDLAQLIRYEHVTADLSDPSLEKAGQILAANDAEIAKLDFTLKDIHGKKVTLSELRGKVVLVNFWATWCPPCMVEMPTLQAIYDHFQPQGLVVLSISDEDMYKVGTFVSRTGYRPEILPDTNGKVAKQFHIDGIPRTFIFDREGKLVAQSLDMRTQRQFLEMLSQAGLRP